jgi:hypothetical protein
LAPESPSSTTRHRAPCAQIEALADRVALRITDARQPHEREGHERYTSAPIIAEEAAVLALVPARDQGAAIPESAVTTAGLSTDQARAITAIATSPWLIQPLSAPAGAGKTTSLKALRAAAHRAGRRRVLLLAPTGKAVDVAVREGAGDTGYTVAKALRDLLSGALTLDAGSLVIVDEAGMVGTPELHELLTATVHAGTKSVLVGDARQLAPVNARGGMFDQLCDDLPWAQRLSEVWRMRDPAERSASLALRDGGPATLRHAIGWYRQHNRLHTGDPVTMSADALAAWRTDRHAGKDALLIADTWEVCDALNTRIHGEHTAPGAPTATAARGHRIAATDIIVSRHNDPTIEVFDATDIHKSADPVRNGNRWRVTAIDPKNNSVAARRIGDNARAVFSVTICANTFTTATPSPSTPPRASLPTPPTPSSATAPTAPPPTSRSPAAATPTPPTSGRKSRAKTTTNTPRTPPAHTWRGAAPTAKPPQCCAPSPAGTNGPKP